jgi:hypothetical protein
MNENTIINISGNNNQINAASGYAVISAEQNNKPDLRELDRLLDAVLRKIPPHLSENEKNKITVGVANIKFEMRKQKPQKTIIEKALGVLDKIKTGIEFMSAVKTVISLVKTIPM